MGVRMMQAVQVVARAGGEAPSLLAVYREMNTARGRWSNRHLHAAVRRAISAGLLAESPGKGNRVRVTLTAKGREALGEDRPARYLFAVGRLGPRR